MANFFNSSRVAAVISLLAMLCASSDKASAQEAPLPGARTACPQLDSLRSSALSSYQTGKFEEAVKAYMTICRFDGASSQDWQGLAESYFNVNRFDLAAQSFEKALALSPQSDWLRVRLVEAYIGERRFAYASDCCYSALNAVTDRYALDQLKALSLVLAKRNQKILRVSMKGHGIEN